jgi:ComF family protein
VADFFYPRVCVGCGVFLSDRREFRHICPRCEETFRWLSAPACKFCGLSCPNAEEKETWICTHCRELNPCFCEGKSVFAMAGIGRALIHTLKYRNGLFLKKDIWALLDRCSLTLRPFLENAVLVPVPLHVWRERRRGYNQSLILSRWVGEWVGGRVEDCLRRVRSTRTQTALNRTDRWRNVRNAFSLKKKTSIDVKGRFVLMDDVFTTGSTLNACAKVLRKVGVGRVDVFTLGHG